jgi:hypothetical protein
MHSGSGYCINLVNFFNYFIVIPELTFQIQQEGKKLVVLPFLLTTNITKLKFFYLLTGKEKI